MVNNLQNEEAPEMMTAKELAHHMSIPAATVYYLAQQGKIPAIRIGGRWRFQRTAIDRDVLQNEEPEVRVPHVTLRIADQTLETLVRKQLGLEGMGVMLNAPEPDTIITDGETLPDATFSGRTISIMPDNAPETLGRHVQTGKPVILTTTQHIADPETLRKLLGLSV